MVWKADVEIFCLAHCTALRLWYQRRCNRMNRLVRYFDLGQALYGDSRHALSIQYFVSNSWWYVKAILWYFIWHHQTTRGFNIDDAEIASIWCSFFCFTLEQASHGNCNHAFKTYYPPSNSWWSGKQRSRATKWYQEDDRSTTWRNRREKSPRCMCFSLFLQKNGRENPILVELQNVGLMERTSDWEILNGELSLDSVVKMRLKWMQVIMCCPSNTWLSFGIIEFCNLLLSEYYSWDNLNGLCTNFGGRYVQTLSRVPARIRAAHSVGICALLFWWVQQNGAGRK